MLDFHVGFDAGSLSEIVRLQGFAALLNPEITAGLTEASVLLENAAVANTWSVFSQPTGALASTIYTYVISPSEVAVAVGSPYGHRREYSFKGPDALGRMFPNDPAQPYLTPAVEQHQQEVAEIMEMAVNSALGRIAA
jgi:hypothetical protein